MIDYDRNQIRHGISGPGKNIQEDPPQVPIDENDDGGLVVTILKTIRDQRFHTIVHGMESSETHILSAVLQGSALVYHVCFKRPLTEFFNIHRLAG